MKVKLVFADWQDSKFHSIYSTEKGIELSSGDFHSGTCFDATITLEKDQHNELESALEKGFIPFFYIRLP
jgi:hypothetical protein